jgi:hypothetical protein
VDKRAAECRPHHHPGKRQEEVVGGVPLSSPATFPNTRRQNSSPQQWLKQDPRRPQRRLLVSDFQIAASKRDEQVAKLPQLDHAGQHELSRRLQNQPVRLAREEIGEKSKPSQLYVFIVAPLAARHPVFYFITRPNKSIRATGASANARFPICQFRKSFLANNVHVINSFGIKAYNVV